MSNAPGLLTSLQRLIGSFVEVLYTRIEILSTELEAEGSGVRNLLLYQLLSLLFLGLGLLLLTLLMVMLFWDTHRLGAVATFAGLYLAIGVGAALLAQYKLKRRPRLFSASLAELAKDRDQLRS